MQKLFILFLLAITVLVSAQEQEKYVDYSYSEGTLEKTDKFKQGMGRYDGYTVPLNKGESLYLSLYSESFKPSLILVSPKGDIFKEVQYHGNDFLNLNTKIPESGDWVLYIVGDKNAEGQYVYQIAFASESMSIHPDSGDVCGAVKYLLLHSNAYNVFLQGDENIYLFPGSVEAYLDGNDASYNNVFARTNDEREAELVFTNYKLLIDECLSDKWKRTSRTWSENEDGYKVKYVEFARATKTDSYRITLQLSDYRELNEEGKPGFSVELQVLKVL